MPYFPHDIYSKFDCKFITKIYWCRIDKNLLERLPLLKSITTTSHDGNMDTKFTSVTSLHMNIPAYKPSFKIKYVANFPNLIDLKINDSSIWGGTIHDVTDIQNLTALTSLNARISVKNVNLLLCKESLTDLTIVPLVTDNIDYTRGNFNYNSRHWDNIFFTPENLIKAHHLRHLDMRIIISQSIVDQLTNLESLFIYDFEKDIDLNCLVNLRTLRVSNHHSNANFRITKTNIANLSVNFLDIRQADDDAMVPLSVTKLIGCVPQKVLDTMTNLTDLYVPSNTLIVPNPLLLPRLTRLHLTCKLPDDMSLFTNLTCLKKHSFDTITQEQCNTFPLSLRKLTLQYMHKLDYSHLTNLKNHH